MVTLLPHFFLQCVLQFMNISTTSSSHEPFMSVDSYSAIFVVLVLNSLPNNGKLIL